MSDNLTVVSSRIRLARNLSGLPFPAADNDENETRKIIESADRAARVLSGYKIFLMGGISDIDRLALVERHLISRDLAQNTDTGAALISQDESVSVMLGEEDHFRIQSVRSGLDLEGAFAKASAYDDSLSAVADLAFDKRLGYLTACPTNVGTGLRASVMLFLPGTVRTGSIGTIISGIQKVGLTVRGVYGEGSEAAGNMYQISNRISLGLSEENIIKSVEQTVTKLIDIEQAARKKLLLQQGILLQDKVMRAYGILTHAKVMDSGEFMELISEVKLGASLGIIENKVDWDEVLVTAQPANLVKREGRPLSAAERDIARAAYVKSAFLGGGK